MSISLNVLQTRIESLEYLIAVARATGDTAAIAALQVQVGILIAQVAALQTSVAANTTSITTINGEIVEIETDITALESSVATNTSNIATNTAAIATNTGNIATNTANIATNTAAIATLESFITSNFFVFVYPIDGTTDDWPSLVATMAANAYKKIIVMLPGPAGQQFQCKSTQNIPSGTTVWGTPGTIIHSTLPNGFSILNCPFFVGPSPAGSTQRAIIGNNTPGLNTITLAGHFVSIGQVINLTNVNGFFGAQYVITDTAVSGANTIVTVDRAILYTFRQSNGDFYLINTTSSPYPTGRGQDVRVMGNGMQFQGSGYAPFELFGAYKCLIKDIEMVGTYSAAVVMDNALECTLEDIFTTNGAAPGAGLYGFFLEGEKNTAINCTAIGYTDGGSFGFGFQSGVLASIVNCKTYSCNNGVQFSSEGATIDQFSVGFSNQIIGGTFSGGSVGVSIGRGNRASKIVGAACNFNGTAGIWLHGPSGSDPAVTSTFISNVDLSKNPATGFILDPLVKGTIVQGMDLTDCGIGMDWEDELTLSGLVVNSTLGTTGPVINFNDSKPSAAPSGELTDFRITCTTNGTIAIQGGSAGATAARLKVTDGTIKLPNISGQGFFMGGANVVVSIADVTIDGTGGTGTQGIAGHNSVIYRIGANVNATTCTTPFNSSGVVANRGTYTATGATPVTIAFADANTLDWCDVQAIVGTPAPAPIVAFVPGTGYRSTSAAGDTNTYAYYIGG
jgi:hypothetical protein